VEALDAGADDYLVKPFDREELLARVRAGIRTLDLQAALAARAADVENVGPEGRTTPLQMPL